MNKKLKKEMKPAGAMYYFEEDNTKKSDRFLLEEQINDCWTIVEQLQLARDASPESKDQLIDAIKVLYQHKFIKLWDTFEDLVQQGKIK